jgi:hypothetical protein
MSEKSAITRAGFQNISRPTRRPEKVSPGLISGQFGDPVSPSLFSPSAKPDVEQSSRRSDLSNGFDSHIAMSDYAHKIGMRPHDMLGEVMYSHYAMHDPQQRGKKNVLRLPVDVAANLVKEIAKHSSMSIDPHTEDEPLGFDSVKSSFRPCTFPVYDCRFRNFAKLVVSPCTLEPVDGSESTKFCDVEWQAVSLIGGNAQEFNEIIDRYKRDHSREMIDPSVEYKRNFTVRELANITMGQDGPSFNFEEVNVSKEEDALPVFYPWLKQDLTDYFEEFLSSTSNVLLLIGPPGTGKSTFIRTMINRSRVDSILCYNEKTMFDENFLKGLRRADTSIERNYIGSDAYYEGWKKQTGLIAPNLVMRSRKQQCVILEDCDNYIRSRKSGNHAMASLLNHINGIASNTNTKFIFSTNLDSVAGVDSALLRPGRCHDILPFRKLSYDEGVAVRTALKFEQPDFDRGNSSTHSLAEIIKNIGAHTSDIDTVKPRFGF